MLLNDRMGLASAFEGGLSAMGSLSLSMAGIYCGAVWIMEQSGSLISGLQALPFDPSLLVGSLLGPDLGGLPLAESVAQSPQMGLFSGLLVSSMLGCLISFALPISLGLLPDEERKGFMEGTVWGIATLPLGLIPGGMMLGMGAADLIRGILPIAIICGLLILGLRFFPKGCLFVMNTLGNLVRLVGTLLFILLVFGLFMPEYAVFSPALAGEAFIVVVKITAVVCGSLVASRLAMKFCKGIFRSAAKKFHTNAISIMGLVVSLATSVSMLPMYLQMDHRGKRMNAAFVVGGAFCLGGQLAYVAAVSDSKTMMAYLVCKLVCGISAVFLAGFSAKQEPSSL